MEEIKQDITKNVKALGQILKEEKVKDLLEKIKQSQSQASQIVKTLNDKESELRQKAKSEQAESFDVAETVNEQQENTVAKKKKNEESVEVQEPKKQDKSAISDKNTAEKTENLQDVTNRDKVATEQKVDVKVDKNQPKTEEKSKVDTDVKAEIKVETKTEEKVEEKPVEKAEEKVETKVEEKPVEKRPSILSFIVKKAEPKENKPRKNVRSQDRNRGRGDRPERNDRNGNFNRQTQGDKNGAQNNNKNGFNKNLGNSSGSFGTSNRPSIGGKRQEVAFIPPKDVKPVRKKAEKSFEDKRATSKKPLKKELTIADFDENKTGYRKVRKPKQKKEEQTNYIKIEKAVLTKELTPIKELSEKFGISAVEITKRLFKEGIAKTVNDSLDFDTAAFIAVDLGIEVEQKFEKTAEDIMNEGFIETNDDVSKLVKRPPIVTVMGHVDHGKTSLLDRIRSANVADGEAGGITQHIGAYSVDFQGNKITFIDTPGHAAFTAMRARGAQVTDIAIIVVAADDGIMPQTIEAINHAKAANVSIIVAANKIDKPHCDLDRVRQQLSEHELLVEEWGGDTIMVPVSAKSGVGIDQLMESILLVAEMSELTANPERKARGTVVEAKLDKGKGPLATVLVQNGTLRTGDNVVAGTVIGRVRAMINDKGLMVKEAGPSTAVSVLGLEDVPNAGDSIFAVDEEKLSKLVAQERKNKEREDMLRRQSKVSLDDLFSKISEGELKTLNLIIKADVQGSAEAVKQSLLELTNEEIKVSVLHAGVGAISETDVTLAESSNAIIIGFNVRPDAKAKVQAERSHIDIKLYRIIYDAIDDIKKAMKGMLAPKFSDVYTGKAEVRETFKISGVGMVAGCHVTDGKIVRNAKLRIYRNDVMICEGNVKQLKRFKDEVKEVSQGYECGISIEGFNDIKIGDFIESYIVEETK